MKGIGCDIIEIERIEKALKELPKRFLEKILTPLEREICTTPQKVAGRFAAKEAVVKALGLGFGKEISFQEIEILNDDRGKPYATLKGKGKKLLENGKILISISHNKTSAIAIAYWM